MKLSDIVKGTIKVGGTVAKVGVEIGADAIGAIAEKIDDNPEDKEKIVASGKNLGKKIRKKTNEIAESSVDVVDDIVETGKEAFEDISQTVKTKRRKNPNKEDSKYYSYEFKEEDFVDEDELNENSKDWEDIPQEAFVDEDK